MPPVIKTLQQTQLLLSPSLSFNTERLKSNILYLRIHACYWRAWEHERCGVGKSRAPSQLDSAKSWGFYSVFFCCRLLSSVKYWSQRCSSCLTSIGGKWWAKRGVIKSEDSLWSRGFLVLSSPPFLPLYFGSCFVQIIDSAFREVGCWTFKLLNKHIQELHLKIQSAVCSSWLLVHFTM